MSRIGQSRRTRDEASGDTGRSESRTAASLRRLALGTVAAGAAAAAYMVFESQWICCRQADLPVPGLPAPWSGLKVLHLADVHAGTFSTNRRSLGKAVDWAARLHPDLVFLTGDILGDRGPSQACLHLLAQLKPKLGSFAVTGNHEYGLGKSPLAKMRDTRHLWQEAGVTLLSDECVTLPPREGSSIVICGADHITGGYGLDPANLSAQAPAQVPAIDATPSAHQKEAEPRPWTPFGPRPVPGAAPAAPAEPVSADAAPTGPATLDPFPILLIHTPPPPDSPPGSLFRLTFAGHTHGGQLRIPSYRGLTPLYQEQEKRLAGVHPYGVGLLVVTRGVGTSFLPFRLLTRPEATLWRLVYTLPEETTGTSP